MLYEKKVKCPLCGFEFKTPKISLGHLTMKSCDTDFLEQYNGGIYTFLYDVIVCYNCGYTAIEKQFKILNPVQKRVVTEQVQKKWVKKDFGGERSLQKALNAYKLALYVSELKRDPAYIKAGILHRIAWIYRIMQNKENENKFITFAVKYYIEAYENNNVNQAKTAYIIGDLYKRLGKKNEAVKWFSIVVNGPLRNSNPLIANMAREGWQECKSHKPYG